MVDFKKDAKIQAAIPFALGVCALLAVIVLPNYLRQTIYTRSQGAHAVILLLVNVLEIYKRDVGGYQSTPLDFRA